MPDPLIGSRDPEVKDYFLVTPPESKYADLREIGHGSFGAVYHAKEVPSMEVVAIKVMNYGGKKSDEKWKDIKNEVKMLRRLSHPNIIQYKQCYLGDNEAWLVMEYCLGSASDVVNVHKCGLKENEIGAICLDVLSALSYVHEKINVIHRDVKAGNILLTEAGVVKLADFGSASLACPANTFVGTPYWMAPEVILAMDFGQYAYNSDIWSLGITCLELASAEGKPPLFNMNHMAALYHIPQNDAPTLQGDDYGPLAKEFVRSCLQKDHESRPQASGLLEHEFIKTIRPKSQQVIRSLVTRTKNKVREADRTNLRKMKIFLMEELDTSSLTDSNGCLQNNEETNHDRAGGSNTSSISSTDQSEAVSLENNRNPNPPSHSRRSHTSNGHALLSSRPSQQSLPSLHRSSSNASGDGDNRNQFNTLRTRDLVRKQKVEHDRDDMFREQMSGYKKMRKQHQKQVTQLNEKQNSDLSVYKAKLSREYELLTMNNERDLEKLQKSHDQLKLKSTSDGEADEKHLETHLRKHQKVEFKKFSEDLSKQKKMKTEEQKKALANLPKKERKEKLEQFKVSQDHEQDRSKTEKQREQRHTSLIQIRKSKRQLLTKYHQLEFRLLREYLNRQESMISTRHSTSRKHHEEVQELEYKNLQNIHTMRLQHLRSQHDAELDNQTEFAEAQKSDMRKRHDSKKKQLPKNINDKRKQIQTQCKAMLETQERQFRVRREQECAGLTPVEQALVKDRLKEEQKFKKTEVLQQYQSVIEEMENTNKGNLQELQLAESTELRQRLAEEKDILMAYQSKIRIQTDGLHSRERQELENRVSERRVKLEQDIEAELEKFNSQRATLQRQLHETHARKIELFDRETSDLGIDPKDVFMAEDEFRRIQLEDDCSVAGLSISTNSSASFRNTVI